jgi:hypothetical protein
MEQVRSEYISFQKGKRVLGRIAQCKPSSATGSAALGRAAAGRGVVLESAGGDFAEYHPLLRLRAPAPAAPGGGKAMEAMESELSRPLGEGEVVGLHAGGSVSRLTAAAGSSSCCWGQGEGGEGGGELGELGGVGCCPSLPSFTGAVGVVSRRAVVRGGLPPDGRSEGYESIAYVGRVPVRVRGAARCVRCCVKAPCIRPATTD